jgi:hypothetical protein
MKADVVILNKFCSLHPPPLDSKNVPFGDSLPPLMVAGVWLSGPDSVFRPRNA